MTRENKLALVVGFGLILLVGILISDHLSAARNPEPAELTRAVDPLSPRRSTPADLIAMRTAEPTLRERQASPGRDIRVPAPEVRSPPEPVRIEMGGATKQVTAPPVAVGLAPADARALPYRFHTVGSGESLSRICGQYYGDPSLALELAAYNDIESPDRVFAGTRLKIPNADDLVRGRTAPGHPAASHPAPSHPAPSHAGLDRPAPAGSAKAQDSTYTVRDGDMLTGIAARLLGSPNKYIAIFEHNRDKLQDPDDLTPGMVLRIP